MRDRPSVRKTLARAWRWVGFEYSGFKTMYDAAMKKIMASSVVETSPRTKTRESDEQYVPHHVSRFAVESIIYKGIG